MIRLFILLLSLNTYAWEDWDSTDKKLFKAYILGTTIDYMQTKNALGNAYIEGNPFLGETPSADRLLAQKVFSAGLIYWTMDTIEYKPYRRRGLLLVNGLQWGIVIHNEHVGATFKYSW